MGRASRQKKERREAEPSHTTLSGHQRKGKELTPPLLQVPNLSLASWTDDRLPEMLWAALLITSLERKLALGVFRAVARVGRILEEAGVTTECTLSALGALPEEHRLKVLEVFRQATHVRLALRPLLLFEEPPGRETWEKVLADTPEPEDWNSVADAVSRTFNHQSEEATDCRWMRTIFVMLNGKLHLPQEMVEEFFYYPDRGDLRKVRPSIRATEGSLSMLVPTAQQSDWPKNFWDQCLRDTRCISIDPVPKRDPSVGTTTAMLRVVSERLQAHSVTTRTTTAVDARHEGVFGLVGFALTLLGELLRMGNGTSILGRLGLRSILEAFVTLTYLVSKDDPELWMEYRRYGSGQAKLAFLKLDAHAGDAPEFVNKDLLEALAGEDRWLEFVPINLGNWGKSNLRQMSDEAGVKPVYDQFYDWTSAFTHGNWAAVRNSVYDLCGNPLHRFHRLLRRDARAQDDVVADSTLVVDQLLELVDRAYPGFTDRLRPTAADPEVSRHEVDE